MRQHPAAVAKLLRRHAARIGAETPPVRARRLVAPVPAAAAAGLEDLVVVEEREGIRVNKSQLWALTHVLLFETAG
jgi:hypothetical protein